MKTLRAGTSAREIRRLFLDYFGGRGHRVVPSSPVIPHGDRTLLFTNAGMNQFKDVFLGKEKREYTRAATVQKCIRAGGKHNDLDNVGYTARHLTFFEMLGNFSFGDYFKEEAIPFAWELLTRGYGLDPARLWVTVYKDDEEARTIWRDRVKVPAERVVGLGEKDNYWSMGDVGPCGPCSEIHVDRGQALACGPRCGLGSCDCDRFFEVWNLVFMQFDQGPDGRKTPLPRPSIDTGMGLERLAMVLQEVDSVFETDLLRGLIARVEELSGVPYQPGPAGVPHRVLADHIRSLVFAFSDGASPSNEGRGYVLRRILRRAARYGRKLASRPRLLADLSGAVVEAMGGDFTEIRAQESYVRDLIASEEERFGRTLDDGIRRFEEVVAELEAKGRKAIPGEEVFFLYDTCGFPVDLVERMAAEIGFGVDLAGYEREMERQKERSRGASRFKAASGEPIEVAEHPPTRFLGYGAASVEGEVLAAALLAPEAAGKGEAPAGKPGEAAPPADGGPPRFEILLSQTPFYAEGGGQVGDTGLLRGEDFLLRVEDTRKRDGRFLHRAALVEGDPARVRPGAVVSAEIDAARRQSIERNHTATHLLHAALRRVVGGHVHQKGSLVEAARLRFDVAHHKPIGPEEIERVEEMVLAQVVRDLPVETFETGYQEAVGMGAMALFGEKYGERVRVVRIGDFSIELCGGTHTERTGEVGDFGVLAEGSVSAGVRRVTALTAEASLRRHQENARIVAALSQKLRCPPESVLERLDRLLASASTATKAPKAPPPPAGEAVGLHKESWSAPGGPVLVLSGVLPGSGDDLLAAFDRHKAGDPRTAAVLLARPAGEEGKVQVLVALTPALTKEGWDAREVFQAAAEDLGARGGGRPEMVRGSGSRPANAEKALQAMLGKLKSKGV